MTAADPTRTCQHPTDPNMDVTEVTVPDQESPDRRLTVRPHRFNPAGRYVVVIGPDDDETGEALTVALRPEDVRAVRGAMTSWLCRHHGVPDDAAEVEIARLRGELTRLSDAYETAWERGYERALEHEADQ